LTAAMPLIKHVSLFAIIILIPSITTDKPNDRGIVVVPKGKGLLQVY